MCIAIRVGVAKLKRRDELLLSRNRSGPWPLFRPTSPPTPAILAKRIHANPSGVRLQRLGSGKTGSGRDDGDVMDQDYGAAGPDVCALGASTEHCSHDLPRPAPCPLLRCHAYPSRPPSPTSIQGRPG